MQHLEVSGAVRLIYGSLGVKRLIIFYACILLFILTIRPEILRNRPAERQYVTINGLLQFQLRSYCHLVLYRTTGKQNLLHF